MNYIVWQACPTPSGWEPWEPIYGHLQNPLSGQLPATEAHWIARGMRTTFHGHLFAVRPAAAGPPLFPEAMADHYDLPPYV
jgi:hypothetical protein